MPTMDDPLRPPEDMTALGTFDPHDLLPRLVYRIFQFPKIPLPEPPDEHTRKELAKIEYDTQLRILSLAQEALTVQMEGVKKAAEVVKVA